LKGSADVLILTCEHGGHQVPRELQPLFRHQSALLRSHRGWDPGALILAQHLSRELDAPIIAANVSRLVVDLNRSPHHRNLYSEITRAVPDAERQRLLARYYTPYRQQVEETITRHSGSGKPVLHLSTHSFTPVLNGLRRNADIGILYDPSRLRETRFARRLCAALLHEAPDLRVRCNYPYRGTADGITAWLRRHHSAARYAGIELELNQVYAAQPAAHWTRLRRSIGRALRAALAPG
jgi:predicted N-formylglutamate amidohydrolase